MVAATFVNGFLPVPTVPGETEVERFDNAARKALTISKEEKERREAEWQKAPPTATEVKNRATVKKLMRASERSAPTEEVVAEWKKTQAR